MFVFVAAILLAASAAFLSSGPPPPVGTTPSTDEMKCTPRGGGGPELPAWVAVLDDEVLEVHPEELDLDDYGRESPVQFFDFVCWKWLEEHYDYRASYGAVYVLTEAGSASHETGQIAVLEAVVKAQDRHREQHGEYASVAAELTGLESLADYGVPSYFQLVLTVTADGWAALVGNTGVGHQYSKRPLEGLRTPGAGRSWGQCRKSGRRRIPTGGRYYRSGSRSAPDGRQDQPGIRRGRIR